METDMKSMREDIVKLRRDVKIIKRILMSQKEDEDDEGELTDWAKSEIEEARKRKKKISHESAENMLFGR